MKTMRRDALIVLVCAAIAVLFTWAPVPQWSRYSAAFVLLWLLPALAWYRLLPGETLVRVVSGLGLAFVGTGLVTLGLHLLPGPFPRGAARGAYLGLVLLPVLAAWFTGADRTPASESPPTAADRRDQGGFPVPRASREDVRTQASGRGGAIGHLGLLVVVVVSLLVRLPNLGYSEFQGDEAVILQRAADTLGGDDVELFLHQKGPVEILLPMALWALADTISEWQARLPFSLAGLLAVLTVAVLAEQWFGQRAGIFAGLLVAINGFLVAFARIVQYQNLVVAMGGLSLLWLLQGDIGHRRRDLMVAAIFLAFGLLAHYDAILVVPAAIAVLGQRVVRDGGWGQRWRFVIGDVALASVLGAAVLALFYLPFVLNPMFSRTFSYLAGGRLGGSLFHNSLLALWRMSTFYNALYYVVGLALLVLVAALTRRGGSGAWLYLGIPLLFYAFVVVDPRTHVYTAYPGAAVLAGAALADLPVRRVRSPVVWSALGGSLGLWYGLCVGFVGMVFVSHAVEYKRAWPESRHPLYPVPFADDALPPYGHFGFPYRAGWKAVAYLYDQGILAGTYASNEEPEITTWYLPEATRTLCGQPDVYIIAEQVQDEMAVDWAELARDYVPVAQIGVGNRAKIWAYRRGGEAGEVLALQAADYAAWYDGRATVGLHRARPPDVAHPLGVDFGTVGRLLGYDLSATSVRRGDSVRVVLAWQALSSPEQNYQVFTHLVDDGDLVAQHDGAPACAAAPTSLWEAGEVIRDEHTITVTAATPAGAYDLYVGMYSLLTFDRLPVDGGPSDMLYLARLEVTP